MSLKRKYHKPTAKTDTEQNLFHAVTRIIKHAEKTFQAMSFIDTMDGSVFFATIDNKEIVLHFTMPAEVGMFCKKRLKNA